MKIDLAGKTAIVAGASAGIGWGCARSLAEAGATVVLVARRQDALESARERLTAAVPGADIRLFSTDLGGAAGCDSLFAAEPRCDILVCSLGLYQAKPFFETPDADWEHLFSLNVMSGVRLARAYMPLMMEAGWGRVVLLSSVDSIVVPGDSLHYSVAKAGVLALSRGLAKLAGRSGVTVNAVLPAPTNVEWVADMIADMAKKTGQDIGAAGNAAVTGRYPSSVLQRVLEVDEVAHLVTYLCSPLSSATTGAALRADGGVVEAIC